MAVTAPGQKRNATAPQTALQVTTRLVQLDVIVKDRHGQLVSGLREEDFKIFDDGVPQGISDFEIEQSHTPASLPKISPDIFTNIPERVAGGSPAITVILLDGLNTRWLDQARSEQQIFQFLKQLQPGDRVGLYALGTRLVMLHDFTSDSAALVRALNGYHGRANSEVAASQADNAENPPEWANQVSDLSGDIPSQAVTSAISDWLARAANLEAEYYMNQRVTMTVEALEAIAQHLRGVPGRKNLIWVSSAFPLMRGIDRVEQSGDFSLVTTYDSELAAAAEALSDANLAVYPVDARGLMVDSAYGAEALARPPSLLQMQRLPQHLADNFPAMNEIAQRTGGRAFYNTNDIKGSIRDVIEDSRLSYLLSYYPANTAWDGKYHKIRVEVNRPGLRLEYRRGYAAIPEAPAAPQTGQPALDAAVISPLDATGVALVVRARAAQPGPGAARNMNVQYWINPRDITLALVSQAAGKPPKWAASITMVTEEFGSRGQGLKGDSRRFNLNLDEEERKQFLAAGLVFHALLPIIPGAERLRVVVRDDPTGNLGSTSIPLDRVFSLAHAPPAPRPDVKKR